MNNITKILEVELTLKGTTKASTESVSGSRSVGGGAACLEPPARLRFGGIDIWVERVRDELELAALACIRSALSMRSRFTLLASLGIIPANAALAGAIGRATDGGRGM